MNGSSKKQSSANSNLPRPAVSPKRRGSVSKYLLFPTCDGERWQNDRSFDSRQKVKKQFLDAYFQTNLAYARLVALRKRYRANVPRAREWRLLKEIERTLVAREKLEDLHASRGLFVTPTYCDGFTINLRFSDGRNPRPKSPIIVSSACVRIVIPLPSGFRGERAKATT